ncbi:TSUP family transporter [Frigoribacterium faeni]|uniref:Probable membrane transporter protein n=1 Tax=Frigoribacterium faeni TaxID=145483 RepID=A0A7W3PHG3_9MICO|nr:TSUP family transporter [Frigoribacterium faeni]MBA8811978.1 hypothetical protein [Frigoribacterium faeni]BFF12978.1 sulfite exporter TauE/SafE family protein [Microbacterium flavescens]GEK84718.1 hypothetical protein FFA01_30270 [Frigoribacterium faeni]
MTPLTLGLAAAAIVLGALTQRMAGIGFALTAAPLLVVVLGPEAGVTVGNVLAAALAAVLLAQTWRTVRWKRALLLVGPALVTIPIGAWVVRTAPTGPLTVAVGAVALVAVLVMVFSSRARLLPGRGGAVAAGALGGFMNVTAGVGGPALTVHATSERWPREVFVGTGQVFLLAINLTSLLSKGVPTEPWSVWAGAFVALALGAVIGHRLNRYVSPRVGRALVLTLAAVGSAAAVVRGVLLL